MATGTTATSGAADSTTPEEEQVVVVKFVPFSSSIESAFWVRYCRAKLETIQLNEDPIPIRLSFAVTSSDGLPRLQCQDNSLMLKEASLFSNNECVVVSGDLIGFNTLESFQKVDKNELLRNYFLNKFFGQHDAAVIDSLNCTALITFADLKNHKVVYWFGIPVLMPSQSIRAIKQETAFSDDETQKLALQIDALRRRSLSESKLSGLPPYFIYSKMTESCTRLSKEAYTSLSEGDDNDVTFGFFDPVGSSSQQQTMMGWPMRNLVAYLCFHLDLGGKEVKIISYRPKVVRRISFEDNNSDAVLVEPSNSHEGDKSVLLTVQVPLKQDYEWNSGITSETTSTDHPQYKVVGWELNARSKPGPRSVNLRPLLDPQHLAIQAADLNLKLMKWRMIPDLKVDLLKSSKVLLIGAGTLGCNVARVLLGWGIRHLKIVDYGKVSYSNPVRQSLFTLDDCHADGGSGRSKAVAAAEALKTIAADVHSEGITLSIPMPGHPEHVDSIREAVETLDKLVQESDAVFLLTDTRESRWLPTVMAAAHNKMLINAALGLDSWLVMRHGVGPAADDSPKRQGCYFCSDVVAPENSTKNRTLDQQCTVTRPGLALIASSMAVELMVSLLHHPLQLAAPAPVGKSSNFSPTVSSDDESAGPLGLIPHQIRGSLVSYTMMTPTIPAFKYCTGCSANVVDAYLKDKVGVVVTSCQTTDGSYLEDIAGLTAFRAEAAEKLVEVEGWEDDE